MKILINAILIICMSFLLRAESIWMPTSVMAGSDFVQAMTCTSNGSLLAASWYSGIYRTTNNGINWSLNYSATGIYCISTAPDGNIYALHYTNTSTRISRSSDDGVTWNLLYNNTNAGNYDYGGGIVFFPGGTIVACMNETIGPLISNTGALIVRSTDNGVSWNQVSLQNGFDFNNLSISGSNIYAACSAIGGSAVVFSSNQGNTWASTNSYGLGLGHQFKIDGSGNFYVGVWTGDNVTEKLYRSTDGGNSWSGAGLAGGNVLSLYIASNGNIYAGTDNYGGGAYMVRRSTNSGQSWVQINDGIPATDKVYSFIQNNAQLVFAGTRYNGVYKTNNITAVTNNGSNLPGGYFLSQNYPNPFNPTTKIKFSIPLNVKGEKTYVKLFIYNVLGKEISTLVNDRLYPGTYEVEWHSEGYSSEIYFYSLAVNGKVIETKKMILIK